MTSSIPMLPAAQPSPSRLKTKPPRVRKGQARPWMKTTQRELARRIEIVARLLGDKQATRTEVHDYCRKNFTVGWRTSEAYMARARLFLLDRARKSREQVLSEAIVFNEDLLRSTTATTREKQDARRELNELYGIYPPRRTELSGPAGEPLTVRAAPPEFTDQECKAILLQRSKLLLGEFGGNGGNGDGEQAAAPRAKVGGNGGP